MEEGAASCLFIFGCSAELAVRILTVNIFLVYKEKDGAKVFLKGFRVSTRR
jgi:hypothetical protein